MSDKKAEPSALMGCDFMIRGKFPKAFEPYAASAAKTIGLRGYISQVSKDTFKGQMQGEERMFEAFKELILLAGEYVDIKEFLIVNLKAIQEYTCEIFEIKVENK